MSDLAAYLIGFIGFLIFVYKIIRVLTPQNDLMDAIDTSLRFAYCELRDAEDEVGKRFYMNQIETLNRALSDAARGGVPEDFA